MYIIYVHTTPDGRKYVGSTSLEPNKRFNGGKNYKCCTRFNDAINLFGWDNIHHQILETVEDKETALKREEYYTLLWRTNEPEFGYNIYVGSIPNQESKKKRSEKMKGIKQSEESNKKRSEKMKGRKQSEYIKNIISEKLNEFYKNKVFSEDERKQRSETAKKPILLMNIKTKEILKFESRRSCAEFFCVTTHALWNFITGKRPKSITFKDYKVLK